MQNKHEILPPYYYTLNILRKNGWSPNENSLKNSRGRGVIKEGIRGAKTFFM
jgi:hypothetical protein